MSIHTLFMTIETNLFYLACLLYVAIYPVFFGFVWSISALLHYFVYDRYSDKFQFEKYRIKPKVSVIIPVYNEQHYIRESLLSITELRYEDFEIIVVNDGSTDDTLKIINEIKETHPIKIINKTKNEGKASALNDTLNIAKGEILLFLDADAIPDVNALTHIVPHFCNPNVAAVTGNPRVRNISSFLCCLQLMEYVSIVSLIRRTQHLWGALMTVSGVVVAVRKKALQEIGGFKVNMATEDISLAWELQMSGYNVEFESNAVIWMAVPTKLKGFVRQRMRWARGLMEVLAANKQVLIKPNKKSLWLVYVEALLSLIWATLHAFLVISFIITMTFFKKTIGLNVIPLFWGAIVCTLALFMQLAGIITERKHDKTIKYYFPYAIFYPLVYWSILSIIAVLNIKYLFKKPRKEAYVRWRHSREDGEM